MKKLISLFLSVLMVLGTLSCMSVVSFAGDFNTTMELNKTVTLNTADNSDVYFIPETNGSYDFFSWCDSEDLYMECCIYDDKGNTVDEFGGYGSFYMKESLKADKKYVFSLRVPAGSSDITEYYIKIKETSDAVNISFNVNPAVRLVEKLNGCWNTRINEDTKAEEKYFQYDIYLSDIFKKGDVATVEYSDGETSEYYFDGWDFYDKYDRYLYLEIKDDQVISPWLLGKENKVTLFVDEATCAFDVEIIEDPVKSVEFVLAEPIILKEYDSGWYYKDEDEAYPNSDDYYYSYRQYLLQEGSKIIFGYKDGSEDVYNCEKYYHDEYTEYRYVNEDGDELYINYCTDSQEQGEIWKGGNVYVSQVLLSNGYCAEVQVEVVADWSKNKIKAPKLTGVTNTPTGAKITWNKLEGATGYIVYYKNSSGKWERLGKTDGTSFIDTKVKSGATRTYTVKAYKTKALGKEEYSKYDNTGKVNKFIALTKLISVKNATNGVKIAWNKVSGASGYYVYRKTTGSWTRIGTVKAGSPLTYTDKTAKNGTEYKYTVKAYSGSSYGAYDSGKTLTYLTAPTPKTKTIASGVYVYWNKNPYAKGYYVYRKTENGSWTKIATVTSGSKLSCTDTTAKSGTTYTYTVRAYNSNGISAYYSGSKLMFLATPKLTKATAQSGKITVAFGKVSGAKSYNVYRKTSGGNWKKIGTSTSGSYIDKTAQKGTIYYYTVRAVNGSYMSSYNSTGVSAKAK